MRINSDAAFIRQRFYISLRCSITDLSAVIKNFLDDEGRLAAFPAKRKLKVYSLCYLSGKFAPGVKYTESDVNGVLNRWHTFGDPATLRRELYNSGFMGRTDDCREYWLEDSRPGAEDIAGLFG